LKVSIILCTYNRLSKLKLCVESVLNQSFKDYEFIIIDDYSNDGSDNYLKELSIEQNNISCIYNTQNIGLQSSLNKGLSIARGSYIARIDDDDKWLYEKKLEEQVEFLDNSPEYLLVGTGYRICNNIYKNPLNDKQIRNQFLFRCPFQHSTVLFRAKHKNHIFKYDDSLTYSEDWDLWMYMALHGKVKNLDIISTEIGITNNLSSKYYLKQLPINRKLYKKYNKRFPRRNLAYLYHLFLKIYFITIPIDSVVHKLFQKVFLLIFLRENLN